MTCRVCLLLGNIVVGLLRMHRRVPLLTLLCASLMLATILPAQVQVVSVSPTSGTYSAGQPVTFSAQGVSFDYWQYTNEYVILEVSNGGMPWNNACNVQYQPATNMVYLTLDSGNQWASGALGSGGTLSNSQCSVNVSAGSVVRSGPGDPSRGLYEVVTVDLPVTFSSAWTGAKSVYAGVINSQNSTTIQWSAGGSITIQ